MPGYYLAGSTVFHTHTFWLVSFCMSIYESVLCNVAIEWLRWGEKEVCDCFRTSRQSGTWCSERENKMYGVTKTLPFAHQNNIPVPNNTPHGISFSGEGGGGEYMMFVAVMMFLLACTASVSCAKERHNSGSAYLHVQ